MTQKAQTANVMSPPINRFIFLEKREHKKAAKIAGGTHNNNGKNKLAF